MIKFIVGAIVVAAAVMPACAADIWAPAGQWGLVREPASCTMVRTFRTASDEITIGFAADPPSRKFRLLIIAPEGRFSGGEIRISAPDVAALSGATNLKGRTKSGAKLWTASFDRDALPGLLAAPNLTIGGAKTNWDIPLGGAAAVMDVITSCEDDLLRSWKVDPGEVANKIPPADTTGWITAEDYPKDAIRAGQQGVVTMLWRIEPSGKVEDCRIVVSSGSAVLDAVSCNLIRSRAHYKPAVDADGKPAPAWNRINFAWVLPRY